MTFICIVNGVKTSRIGNCFESASFKYSFKRKDYSRKAIPTKENQCPLIGYYQQRFTTGEDKHLPAQEKIREKWKCIGYTLRNAQTASRNKRYLGETEKRKTKELCVANRKQT